MVLWPEKATPIDVGPTEGQVRPDEMHIIPDGAVDDKPSVLFVLVDRQGRRIVAQISERMLRHGVKALDKLRSASAHEGPVAHA